MGAGEHRADIPVRANPEPDARRARAAVLADDPRQFEMDFEAQATLSAEVASAADIALVEDALGDLDQFEGEISNRIEPA